MSKTKISSYFGGERNEQKDKDQERDQNKLNVEEDDSNTNPKVGKTSNKSHNFQAKWMKEHTWLRYENESMFCHFCHLGKKKNPFARDKGYSNFKTMTLTRHLSSREHQDATMEARLRQTFTEVRKQAVSEQGQGIIAAMKKKVIFCQTLRSQNYYCYYYYYSLSTI